MKRFLTIILLACLVIGCSDNKPLDLILDEATRPTSEVVNDAAVCYKALGIDNTQQEYTLIFDKSCIDALFTTDDRGVPTDLPAGVQPTELSVIVDDVALGNTTYEKAWVYTQGTVIEDLTGGGRSLLLQTDNDTVRFRVSSFVKKSQLVRWTKGNRYGFILFITNISMREDTGITTIFSRTDDPDNIRNGRSLFTPSRSEVLPIDLDVMLDSFRKGESYYIGKRVSFPESVKSRTDDTTLESTGETYDRLVVYQEKVPLFATGRDTFGIYQTMNLFEGDIDQKYSKGSFHIFEVTIHYLSGEDFFNPDKVSIVGYFKDATFLPE